MCLSEWAHNTYGRLEWATELNESSASYLLFLTVKATTSQLRRMFYEQCLHSSAGGCYRDSLDVTAKLINA